LLAIKTSCAIFKKFCYIDVKHFVEKTTHFKNEIPVMTLKGVKNDLDA